MPDQPTALSRTVAFVALLQALCAHFAEADAVQATDRGVYQQNRWAASRFGADAELLRPDANRTATVAELGAELLALVAPKTAELGTTELVEGFADSKPEGRLQLAVGRARGLQAVSADVVERTLIS
jgi:gamma-glutamyl:cysteine ligase YbdK (ATP-grasp superfamily)